MILFSTPSKAASLFIPFFLLSAVMPSAKIQEPMYINANWEFVQQFGVATQLSDLVEMHNVLLPVGESKSDIRLVNKLKRVFTFFSVCSTRLKCHSFRDCCVDSPVSYLPVNCILVDALFIDEIIQNTDSVSKKFRRNVGVLAIDSCPLDTDKELVDQCRSSEHLVVSTMTNLVYRNRACATCCNDTDVIEFGTKLACVDDNLVNKSKSPMWERIIKGECVLVEVIPPGYKQMVTTCIKEPKRDAQITSRCNVTGLWKDYDETINWACEHLNFIVNDFKNVFCILCNPGLASTIQQPIIGHETCTYTLKDSFEHELANKCETAEQTPRWHPFKNIYCLICYDPWANQTVKMLANFGIEHFIHLEFNILEKIENMEKHLYQLIGMFESRHNAWTQYKRPNILELSPFISKIYGGINEMCGSVGLCKNVNQTIVTTNTRKCISCTCNPPCTDKHIPCCFDKLLQYDIYNCIEGDKFLTIRKGTYDRAKEKATFYRVIDRCPDYGLFDLVLDGKCMSTTDQLSNVPVHLQDQVTTYKNIYCLQCNENAVLQNERKNSMYNFKTYLKITCHSYIDERLIVSIDIVIFLAKSHDCTVQFTLQQSGQARVCPYVYAENILKYDCFDGKQWQAIRDENKLCTEHQILSIDFPSLIYNFALCLGMNCTRYVIMSCRNSDSNVLEKSTICSFSTADVISHTDGHNPLLPSFPGSTTFGYHDLFSISRQEIDKIRNLKKDPPTVCIQSQCADFECNGERIYVNGSCRYILDFVGEVAYSSVIHLRPCEKEHVFNNQWLNISVNACEYAFKQLSETISELGQILDMSCYTFGCNGDELYVSRNHETFALKITVTMVETHQRSKLENSLLDIFSQFSFYFDNDTICSSVVHENTIWKADNEKCSQISNLTLVSIKTVKAAANVSSDEAHSVIQNTLICPLKLVNISKFKYQDRYVIIQLNGFDDNISVLQSDIILERHNSFQSQTVKVCASALNAFGNNMTPNRVNDVGYMQDLYRIFDWTCTVVSMLGLLIVITTYFSFSVLRTIPGKNNLMLAILLFLAQLILLWVTFADIKSTYLCRYLGISLHIAWLAAFCAMNVCSFHMFDVFSVKTMIALDAAKSSFVRYIVWVSVVPTLIVSVVISVNLASSNGVDCGYGNRICFLNNIYSLIAGFIVPSSLIFISNAVFYGITFYKIRNSPTLQSNQQGRRDLAVYVKLCTITGLSWPLLIIDGIFERSVFSFIATFVNASQGLFMFFAFVCNKRVMCLYYHAIFGRQTPGSTPRREQDTSQTATFSRTHESFEIASSNVL